MKRLALALRRLGHQLWDLPRWAAQPKVPLRLPILAFVAATWAAVALAGTQMSWQGDWTAAVVASVLVAGMAAYAIPSFGGVQGRWSVSAFFHLAFTFAIGPPAVLTMAIGQAGGSAVRRRPGMVRTLFNAGDTFLADTAAWVVFHHLTGGQDGVAWLALRGAAGAAAESVVNVVMVATAVSLAGEPSELWGWVRQLAQQTSISLLFGVTAAGATHLYKAEGTFGIVTLLLPLAMVQGSMVVLARRTHEHVREQAAQAEEREALLRREAQARAAEARASRVAAAALRRAATASETERHRIAADLHDGVIQDVYGLFIAAGALTQRLDGDDAAAWSRESIRRYVEFSKGVAAGSARDLRALMVELAPPLLDQEGLAAALRLLLARLDRESIRWTLECPEDPIDPRQQRLVHRVVQEAVRNILKHSQCRSVEVSVRFKGPALVASVHDDGRGFSEEDRARQRAAGHNGLGMLDRTVRDGGGHLTVESAPGRGTTVTLRLVRLSPGADEAGEEAEDAADAHLVVFPARDEDSHGSPASTLEPDRAHALKRRRRRTSAAPTPSIP